LIQADPLHNLTPELVYFLNYKNQE
jgi:hypothetical protein